MRSRPRREKKKRGQSLKKFQFRTWMMMNGISSHLLKIHEDSCWMMSPSA